MNKKLLKLGICALSFALVPHAFASEFYAELTANGGSITGEPHQTMVAGVDVSLMIEGLSLDHKISRDARGAPVLSEIRIVKRVNRSSIDLHKALARNELIEGTIHFFRPSQVGLQEEFYSLALRGGHITSIAPWTTSIEISGANASVALYEAVTISYTNLTITDVINGAQFAY